MSIIKRIANEMRTKTQLRVFAPSGVLLQTYSDDKMGLDVAESHSRAVSGWVSRGHAGGGGASEEVFNHTAAPFFNVYKNDGDLLGRYVNGFQAEKDARTINGYVKRAGKIEHDHRLDMPDVTFDVMLMDRKTVYRFLHDEQEAIKCAKRKGGIVYRRTVKMHLDFRRFPVPDDSASETTYDEEENA